MANHKSSEKRARQTITKTANNKAWKSKVRTAVKSLRTAITNNDKTAASKSFPEVQSLLRKLAKVGVIKTKTAGRVTSRLATQVSKLK